MTMKTSIIPIFIPHIGCPHRCVFCNQWQITGHHGLPTRDAIRELIGSYTASAGEGRHWEVAFYGGSFTAIPMPLQQELLPPAYEALKAGVIQGIRWTTGCCRRPSEVIR